jgi:8-oxo-dGTP diphosphatase
MKSIPCASIIIENLAGHVLLLLRDDKPDIAFPNYWTLVGGKVEEGETPEMAAHRELEEETGLKTELSLWKRYNRQHPFFIVDQYVFLAKVDSARVERVLGEGQALHFFKPWEIRRLKIGYEFDALLIEYFLTRKP